MLLSNTMVWHSLVLPWSTRWVDSAFEALVLVPVYPGAVPVLRVLVPVYSVYPGTVLQVLVPVDSGAAGCDNSLQKLANCRPELSALGITRIAIICFNIIFLPFIYEFHIISNQALLHTSQNQDGLFRLLSLQWEVEIIQTHGRGPWIYIIRRTFWKYAGVYFFVKKYILELFGSQNIHQQFSNNIFSLIFILWYLSCDIFPNDIR